MGGKNCVIVDSDADLDDAVPAIVSSAFGFAGQKCSAASRVLVHERIADALIERLAGARRGRSSSGRPTRSASTCRPVIERDARRARRALPRPGARAAGRIAAGARATACPARLVRRAPPWFPSCRPTPACSREEIFGPVLAIERVAGVEAACDASSTRCRSRSPAACSAATRTTVEPSSAAPPVGNLYVNRQITGAMVGRQPFGGNRLSGTGTKAGGPDYLLHFVEPRVVTENTMRHGLVI